MDSLSSFDLEAYNHYARLENGDMSWIIPGKFLAFSCPSVAAGAVTASRSSKEGSNSSSNNNRSSNSNSNSNRSSSNSSSSSTCHPWYYVDVFKKLKIKLVIRLNTKMYDSKAFKDVGIDHHDLFFLDGTCPPRDIMERFVELCEACDGAVAVHCKAGLGRTGSLIGCYAIKNYKYVLPSFLY
ncbi:dual specificity protein phosphatase CDC14A, putative [Eimeria praecox]|uniref:protein-tyrosine-phosphatase n=1 Tax=Eimeria praecox TaxID=51316 RepID=U6H6G7_9EIME|nr:dual specificity protein phosphatase CDC14A, putative [Eimeria praecox]